MQLVLKSWHSWKSRMSYRLHGPHKRTHTHTQQPANPFASSITILVSRACFSWTYILLTKDYNHISLISFSQSRFHVVTWSWFKARNIDKFVGWLFWLALKRYVKRRHGESRPFVKDVFGIQYNMYSAYIGRFVPVMRILFLEADLNVVSLCCW